jgi:CBS domain-containing protein
MSKRAAFARGADIMRIREVMSCRVEIVFPDNTVHEAAARMKARNVGSLPVCEHDRVVGMITDRDIVIRAVAEGKDSRTARVRDIMTSEVVYCDEDLLIAEAALLMQERKVRRLVVLNREQQLVGIVSLSNLATDTGDEELAGQTLEEMAHAERR